MSHKPGYTSPNRPLEVRVHPLGRKQEFIDVAKAAGDVPSDLINGFIAWYLGYDELTTRPVIDREQLHATATSG